MQTLRRIAQRAGVRPLYFYAVVALCVATLAFAFWRDHEAYIAGPQPSVGLYWIENVDPTIAPGVSAPLWQLLIRTDVASMYYKSGTANTAWTKIGSGAAGGITSIACGIGQTCTPNPITTTGTVAAIRGSITPPDFSGTTVNDYNPAGLSTAYVILQACTGVGDTIITGLAAQPAGTVIAFVNTGYFQLTFVNNNAGSLPANRFALPDSTSWTLAPFYSVYLYYTGSNWIVLAGLVSSYYSLSVGTRTDLGQLRFSQPQTYSDTGQTDNLLPFSSTTIINYTGAGDATLTGLAGNATGRLIIIKNDSGFNLSLPDHSSGSFSVNQFANPNGGDIVLSGTSSTAIYMWDSVNTIWQLLAFTSSQSGVPVLFTSSKNTGTITLAGGTGTATVQAGSHCVCDDSTALLPVQCAVSGTTLTATGTGTDAITYVCL